MIAILDQEFEKKGLKFDELLVALERHFYLGFVKVRESSRTQTFDRTPKWTTLENTCNQAKKALEEIKGKELGPQASPAFF